MKLDITRISLFDPSHHAPNSAWWQFCVLLKNMEDPRLAAGMNIFTAVQIFVMLGLAAAIVLATSPAANCPTPKGVITANEQPNR